MSCHKNIPKNVERIHPIFKISSGPFFPHVINGAIFSTRPVQVFFIFTKQAKVHQLMANQLFSNVNIFPNNRLSVESVQSRKFCGDFFSRLMLCFEGNRNKIMPGFSSGILPPILSPVIVITKL